MFHIELYSIILLTFRTNNVFFWSNVLDVICFGRSKNGWRTYDRHLHIKSVLSHKMRGNCDQQQKRNISCSSIALIESVFVNWESMFPSKLSHRLKLLSLVARNGRTKQKTRSRFCGWHLKNWAHQSVLMINHQQEGC